MIDTFYETSVRIIYRNIFLIRFGIQDSSSFIEESFENPLRYSVFRVFQKDKLQDRLGDPPFKAFLEDLVCDTFK